MDLSKFPLASEWPEDEEEEDSEDVSKYDLMADSDNEPAARYMSPLSNPRDLEPIIKISKL